MQCAECGHTARDEADVTRSRRQIGRALLAIAGVIAIAVAARVRLLDRGVWSIAPTSVLLLAAPAVDDGGYRSAPWELAYRVRSGAASDAQALEAFALFVEGDDAARPPSTEWRAKYRDLGSAAIARLGVASPALLRLYEIPPAFEIAAIPGAVIDGVRTPALLSLDADVWWPDGSEGRLTIEFADGTSRTAEFRPDGRYPALLLELPADAKPGDPLRLTMEHRRAGSLEAEKAWEAHPVALGVLPAWSATARMQWTPVNSAEMREAITRVFDSGLAVWSAGSPRAGMRFDQRLTAGELFQSTAVGLRVEILEDGVVRRTSRMWWMAGGDPTQPQWLPTAEDSEAMARLFEQGPESSGPRWTLRVTGDEGLAHHAAIDRGPNGATRWYSGQLEVPLAVERMNSPSPARRWRLQSH